MKDMLVNYQRWQRYRLAGKTLKYRVYVALESLFVFISVAAISVAIVNGNKPIIWLLSLIALALSWLHHAKYFFYWPWIFLTCLAWALIFISFMIFGFHRFSVCLKPGHFYYCSQGGVI